MTDYLFGEISVYEYPEEVRKDIEKLKNYIANLMWEEAIEMINNISNALSEI